MSEFKTFMSLTDSVIVDEMIQLLEAHKIAYKLQDTSKDFDVSFAHNEAKNSFLIMLNPNDFDKASLLLEENVKLEMNTINSQHPFFNFTTEELKDVVKNYDEWYPADVKLARQLLEKENIVVEDSEIKGQQNKKMIVAQTPEKSSLLTLAMGYTFCLMGGLAGIGIAIFLMIGKRTMPDGTKNYIYSKSDRAHGFYMLVAGAFIFLFFTYKYL